MRKSVLGILVVVLIICAASVATASVKRGDYSITVLTGPSSGIYFPIGGAFSTFIGSLGYKASATATGATAENIEALQTGQGEMAIAMVDSVIQAVESFGAYEGSLPAKDLRALMGLWPNFCQIVTTTDSGIKTFEDMKGKRVGVGARNSGVELNARMMFEAHGMTYADCEVDYLNYGEAIDQIKNGLCDVAFVTSGLGNATIMELGTSKQISFVPVEGEALRNLLGKYPFYVEETIPAAVYGTDRDTTTAAVMNIMLIDKNLPDDVVYDLLENIYSPAGLEAIQSAHATAKANISLETALRGIAGTSIPLHDGALQFYRDKGIDTSPSLSLRIYDWKTEELYISKPARADSELFFGWVHSLEKIPWNEYYHVDKDLRIVLDAVTFPAFGAGIPENKGGTCYVENGLIHMEEIDQPFTELVWLNSRTATQEIRLDGEYVTRGSELPHHARLRLVFERG